MVGVPGRGRSPSGHFMIDPSSERIECARALYGPSTTWELYDWAL